MKRVRHYALTSLLRKEVELTTNNKWRVIVRIGGDVTDANVILVRSGRKTETWRVGPENGRIRGDHWNIYGQVKDALTFRNPDDVYSVFEYGINTAKDGYVELLMERRVVARAQWVMKPH